LQSLARTSAGSKRPMITTLFGNPYVAIGLADLPAMLLTYDFYDLAEASAVRAIAGDAPISGHLPIALPGLFEAGWGIVR
jgi:beta-N-acetylhexosaminidase